MIIGQNIAARKKDRVRGVMLRVGAITLSVALLFALSFLIFPQALFGIFTSDTGVLDIVDGYLPIMMMSFVFAAVFALIAAVFFAVLDSKKEKKTVGAVVKTDMSLMWHGKVPLLGAALGSGMANVIMTYLSSRLPGGYLYPITLGSVVVLVSLFSILVLKEKPSKPGLIGILIGLVAIVVTNM
jgi:drug/metabolite transporter (DMT)-like permease